MTIKKTSEILSTAIISTTESTSIAGVKLSFRFVTSAVMEGNLL